ncbi:hypothetical protein TNCV_2368571 [Trichonephila clavipes]|nr:hypothetical protein TNCV_2368571 [Trichonephila clavipes]
MPVKCQVLFLFQVNTRRFVKDAKEESDSGRRDCGDVKDFQPVPREMQGRRKERLSEYLGFRMHFSF